MTRKYFGLLVAAAVFPSAVQGLREANVKLWDFEKIQWKRYTDILNERSQQAIARLGAVREGVLRRHRKRPDGSWRDTVVFGMTADEWPDAGHRLRERLAAGGSAEVRTEVPVG